MIKKLTGIIRKKPWLSILAIIYMAAMIAVSIPKSMDITEDSDYWAFWQGGKDFADKHELNYTEESKREFFYPPFAAFILQPLHLIPLKLSALIFFLINALILLPLAIYLIYSILRLIGVDARKAELTLILATLFTLKYFWNNLVMFQVNFILFDVMLIGFYYLARKKPHIAGIMFTIITFFKIIPGFLAAYVFLFHFSRRVFISMLLTVVICLTLPAAFRGIDLWVQDHVNQYENMLKPYILKGRIVADQANHSLKAGLVKTFHPESRTDEHVYPEHYPVTVRIISILQLLLLVILLVNGFILYRRKVYFSLAYLASILLFTHLVSGITWTAHMVTLMFCILPVLLIDVKTLKKPGKIAFYIFIAFMVFLGIEGSDTVGEKIYLCIRFYDVYTYLLIGLFLFCSWVVWSRRSDRIYPEGILI